MTTPTVSLQSITGTFDGTRDENRDRILSSDLVEFLGDQPGASVFSLVLDVDGDIPAEGLEVIVNSDSDFSEYFSRLGRQPFSVGGEVVEATYADDGTPTGIKLLVTGPNALFSFNIVESEEAETDGSETLTFSLADSADYTVNSDAQASTITFYDTLADVPSPTSMPTVGISIDNTELVEANCDSLTLTNNEDSDNPNAGGLVYVNSGVRAAVGEFNIFNAEVSGGVFPSSNFLSSGFYFKVFENGASIKLDVFDETTNPEIEPEDAVEGIENFTFSIVEGPGYGIDANASSVSYSIADAADSVPLVSLETSPAVLVESEATVAVVNLEASALPADGLLVTLDAAEMNEFDPASLTIEGAVPVSATPDNTSFTIRMTELTATVSVTVADDGEAEALETAVFSLAESDDYLINPAAGSGEFIISDTPVPPPPSDNESNDTIATAVATGLTADNQFVSISGELDQQRTPPVDRTEDVDMYSVDMAAGDVLRIDTDAQAISDDNPDTVLRVFDADGNQIVQSDDDFAPDELFAPGRRDSYIEFTAETAGSYYVGVSSFGNGEFDFFVDDDGNLENDPYDPNEAGSGTGRSFGEYTLNMSLNQEFTAAVTEIPGSTGEGPTVSLSATPATYDSDDNLISNALVQFTPEFRNASILTLGLDVEGAIPEEGVEVFLTSNIDLSTVFSTRAPFASEGIEVLGAVFNDAGEPIGLKANLTASRGFINLNLADPEEAPTDGEETVSFMLEPAEGYVVGEGDFSTTIYDTLDDVPPLPTVPTVDISVSETALVESEGNTTTLTFTLDSPPPAEGVTVNLDSGIRAALGEFNVFDAEIVGGNFPSPNFRASGFFFTITEQTATITLSAFDETTNPAISPEDALEGIDELTFTLNPGVGYAIAPDADAVTVTIADNPDSVVIEDGDGDGDGDGEEPMIPFEEEFNDTIADATDTGLSPDSTSFLIRAEIDSTRATRNFVDPTEDVDMYAFTMKAGDTVTLDVDSIPFELEDFEGEQRVDTEIRVFNEAGEELLLNTEGTAPGELFASGRDAYVEFTATEDGTYYAGVAMLSNRAYDPNLQGSGSGRAFERFGISPGEYTFEATLTPAAPDADQRIFGTSGDDTLDGGSGNDVITADLGSDIVMGGRGNDVIRADSNLRTTSASQMPGDDIVFGGSGNDTIGGFAGNDILSGDGGDDIIRGGAGDDILMGVTGDDILKGGSGADTFVFGNGDGTDIIRDFEVGMDKIGLVDGELTFEDLTITQQATNTVLGVASTGETLAVLNRTQALSLTESSFVIVPDVSNLEEALTLI